MLILFGYLLNKNNLKNTLKLVRRRVGITCKYLHHCLSHKE